MAEEPPPAFAGDCRATLDFVPFGAARDGRIVPPAPSPGREPSPATLAQAWA